MSRFNNPDPIPRIIDNLNVADLLRMIEQMQMNPIISRPIETVMAYSTTGATINIERGTGYYTTNNFTINNGTTYTLTAGT